MAEVTISYKGQAISEFSASGTKTLETAGTYCEGDITVTYDRPQTGSGSAISIIDELDEHGGTIRTIMGVSLEGDTVSPSVLYSGYTAHNSLGEPIVGTASGGSTTIEQLNVSENGTYTAPAGKAYSPVVVSVSGGQPNLQTKSKSYTPSESQQTEAVTADSGYDGLGTVNVTVGAISSTYVGSGITRRSSTDLTASGATVTAPAGYYSASASKAVASGSATAPASISGTSATVSTGTNTLTLTKTVSVTPSVTAGYVSSGTAGNSSVSLTASVTTKAATTYNTSSSDQTIASGTYLTGAQTIRGVTTTNLSAANVKAGTTIQVGDSADADRVASVTGTFTSDATATAAQINSGATAYVNGSKVTGTQVIQTYYTGSTTPASSLGINGDLYLKVG